MPAFTGNVQIINLSGGNVQFGDTLNISPKSNSKSTNGAGNGSTGAIIFEANGISATNHFDTNLIDQPNIGGD